jgi:hypothetical protein
VNQHQVETRKREGVLAVKSGKPPVHESSPFGPSGGEGIKGEDIGGGIGWGIKNRKSWFRARECESDTSEN